MNTREEGRVTCPKCGGANVIEAWDFVQRECKETGLPILTPTTFWHCDGCRWRWDKTAGTTSNGDLK